MPVTNGAGNRQSFGPQNPVIVPPKSPTSWFISGLRQRCILNAGMPE